MQNLDIYIVLDLETTGLDPLIGAEIMEFGAVKVKNGHIVEEFSTLLQTKNPPPLEIEILTGIHATDLTTAPTLADMRQQITDFIADLPIVGHNISFDTGFLTHYGFKINQPIIDTCALASALVPDVDSYSLETLVNHLKIPTETAHRALGDVKMTQILFEHLRSFATSYPTQAKKTIQTIGEKFSWAPSLIFSGTTTPTTPPAPTPPTPPTTTITLPSPLSPHTLLSIPPHTELPTLQTLTEHFTTPTLIITRNAHEAFYYSRLTPNSTTLFAPQGYLDPSKLEILQKNLAGDESQLLFWLKVFLWSTQTTTGSVSELSFRGQDYAFWDEVSATSPDSAFFQTALASAQSAHTVFTTLHQISLNPETFSPFPNLILLGTEEVDFRLLLLDEKKLYSDKLITFLEDQKLDPQIINQTDLFFGLAGSLVKDFTPDSPYPTHQLLTAADRSTPTFARLRDAGSNLSEIYQSTPHAFLTTTAHTLTQFLNDDPTNVSWITAYPNGTISLHSNSIDLGTLLHTVLQTDSRENVIFLSEHFFQGVITFLRTELNLPTFETLQVQAPDIKNTLHFSIADPLPAPDNWHSETNMQNYILDLLQETETPTIVIFSSKKMLNQYFDHFFPLLQDTNYTLLGEGRTGGLGKNINKFANNPLPLLFISERTFRRASFIPLPNLRILLTKLPFEWASPINQARASRYQNDFAEFSLPQALLKFDRLLTRSSSLVTESGTFLCLDRRLVEKSYGKEFCTILKARNKN